MKPVKSIDRATLGCGSFRHKILSSAVLFFGLFVMAGYSDVDWTAYNDCIGSSAFLNPNTTEFTNYLDYTGAASGLLKNDATGSTAGMPTVTFTIPTNPAVQPDSHTDYGSTPDAGTDAFVIFNGKVDFSGTILEMPPSCVTECWFVEIKFTGLNPLKRYTFVGTAFRNREYADRKTQCTIQGADAYVNNSSEGVYLKNADVTQFHAADNSNEGYVVRWDGIDPGSDGEFSIYTVSADAGGRLGYPLHGFMLQQINLNNPPVVNAGADQAMTLPRQYLSLTGSITDDGVGEPIGYLQSTWSQISGPGTVQFMTDIHLPQVTVRFPAAGIYELQLEAADGLLNASDAVMVIVSDPSCPVGDVDGDCKVTLSDLGLIGIDWLDDSGASIADLDGDAWVKMPELSLLGQSWLDDWTGSLRVTILPAEVVAAGAKWRVDGGVWRSSGATVASLTEGSHEIEYSVVAGWATPASQAVQITRQQTTVTSGSYTQTPQYIVISEFMATNSYIPYINTMNIYTRYPWNTGSTGNVYPDWIELHNTGTEAINLAGWYLTDDPDKLTKWQFPSDMGNELVLAPDDYFILFASNKEQTTFAGNYPFKDYYGALHTNFELGSSGEYLAVVAPDGMTISHEYNDYPEQFPFTSYGIASDETIGYMTTPTPGTMVNGKWQGAANAAGLPGKVTDTKFSHARGIYESAFDVLISCDTVGVQIHYTRDGTEPQSTVGGSTLLYSAPIHVSTTTCLRAKAFKAGLLASNVDTQTYLFLDSVVNQLKPADSRYSTDWGGYPADYEMENNATDIKLVAGNATYTVTQAKAVIKNALQQIPTLSVVTDPDGLFGSVNGIYTHTLNSGDDWERPVSAEYFGGDPNDTFQVDGGLRIQGGASREPYKEPKHSFSLRFRGGYGDAKLKADILNQQTSVDTFDSLQLRSTFNNSWTHWDPAQRARGMLIRDQFARDCLIAMGQEDGCAGTYVHLYLNGLYWGVYNMHERPEASHYAAYHGGDADYYDALNGGVATDGVSTSWNNLQTTVQNADSSSQTDWEAINAKLDVENYIDWTIYEHYGYNHDLKSNGNWKVAGGGVFDAPWRWYLWDTERTIEEGTVGNTGPTSDFGSPFLLGYLRNFEEFRIQFADRLYKHFRNQGALTYASARARYNARVTELYDAMIGESARWGDYRRDVVVRGTAYLYTKNDFWLPEFSRVDGYLLSKETSAINYFKGLFPALYPSIEPPGFKVNSVVKSGGQVPMPCTFDMTNNNGTGSVYYTLDGTDPREYWTGDVSSNAVLFDGTPIQLDKSVTVKARVKNGTTWSALHDATYADEQIPGSLRITEMMYHPADPNTEFIELQNIGTETINLNLTAFTNGVDFTFGDISVAPNGYVVVVQDAAAFTARYPAFGDIIAGQYTGSLDNAGEKIALVDAIGTIIHQFSYKDGWYDLADGPGFSLTVRDSLQNLLLWDQKEGWRASLYAGGTPGAAAQTVLAPGSIVINELLAHSHATDPDWIELHNTTAQDINIGGWFLSDNNNDDPNLMKYRIPDNTVIRAQGSPGNEDYVVFVEDTSFGSASANEPFGLSEAGETVYLTSGENGLITGFYQTEENFDASETGITFGRYEKAELSGGYDFTRMISPTQGGLNSGPLIPDIIITEIHYNPPGGSDYEFVELYNCSGTEVTLMTTVTTETSPGVFITESIPWRLEGTGYEFPANTVIGPGEAIIVVRNPANYSSAPCAVYGPYDGTLDNGGEQIELQIPGDQEYGKSRYWIPIEKIDYDDTAPWPTSADGGGDSLHRMDITYSRDYSNWQAWPPDPGL